MPFIGLLWAVGALLPLIYFQRLLHREFQLLIYFLTRNKALTISLFSLIFFPGVLLHETSHFLMARVLGVRTGKFSLMPQTLKNGQIQLGYVETETTDILRDSLIGAAPIIVGTLFVAYAGLIHLHLDALWNALNVGQMDLFWLRLKALPNTPDFFLWIYLIFIVSSAMLPSASDRHAWLPLGVWIGALLALTLLVGGGKWMLTHLAPILDPFLRSTALLLFVSGAIHLALLIPLYLLRRITMRLTGASFA